jgi:hypothetical protein
MIDVNKRNKPPCEVLIPAPLANDNSAIFRAIAIVPAETLAIKRNDRALVLPLSRFP